MRRVVIAIVVSIAAVAPGIAWRSAEEGTSPGAQRISTDAVGLCIDSFGTDISGLLQGTPGSGWVVVSGDCTSTPGCDDYFVLSCEPDSLVEASFCSNGGGASWNTNLSVWDGGALELCEDDSCGPLAAIAYPYAGGDFHRFRIGGTNGDAGDYSLAVNIPANCFVGDPIGVGLQSLSVDVSG